MFAPYHRILTFDGGHDSLQPGRWIAQADPRWLDHEHGGSVHGRTEAEAVDALKQILSRKNPNAPWFTAVPVVRMR